MKVAIYQVIPELDRTRMLYNNLEFIRIFYCRIFNNDMWAVSFANIYSEC